MTEVTPIPEGTLVVREMEFVGWLWEVLSDDGVGMAACGGFSSETEALEAGKEANPGITVGE